MVGTIWELIFYMHAEPGYTIELLPKLSVVDFEKHLTVLWCFHNNCKLYKLHIIYFLYKYMPI